MFVKAAIVLFVLTIGISLSPDGSSTGLVSARPNPTDLGEDISQWTEDLVADINSAQPDLTHLGEDINKQVKDSIAMALSARPKPTAFWTEHFVTPGTSLNGRGSSWGPFNGVFINGHKGDLNFGTNTEQINNVFSGKNPSSSFREKTDLRNIRISNVSGNVNYGSTLRQEGNVYTA